MKKEGIRLFFHNNCLISRALIGPFLSSIKVFGDNIMTNRRDSIFSPYQPRHDYLTTLVSFFICISYGLDTTEFDKRSTLNIVSSF